VCILFCYPVACSGAMSDDAPDDNDVAIVEAPAAKQHRPETFLGDLLVCETCFDETGKPLRGAVATGRAGEGLVGGYSTSSVSRARRGHVATSRR
jgi:hypothetical protein